MQRFAEIALAVTVGGAVVAWLVGRLHPMTGGVSALLVEILARTTAVVVLFWSTMRFASHGGLFIVPAVALGLLTLATAALTALRAYAYVLGLTGRIPDTGEEVVRR